MSAGVRGAGDCIGGGGGSGAQPPAVADAAARSTATQPVGSPLVAGGGGTALPPRHTRPLFPPRVFQPLPPEFEAFSFTPALSPQDLVDVISTVLEGMTAADVGQLPWTLNATWYNDRCWRSWAYGASTLLFTLSFTAHLRAVADAAAEHAAWFPSAPSMAVAQHAGVVASRAEQLMHGSRRDETRPQPLVVIPAGWVAARPPAHLSCSVFYGRNPPPRPVSGRLIDVRDTLAPLVARGDVSSTVLLLGLVLLQRASASAAAAALSGWTVGRLLPAAMELAAQMCGAAAVRKWPRGRSREVGMGEIRDARELRVVVAALCRILDGNLVVWPHEMSAHTWLLFDEYDKRKPAW